MHNVSKTSDQMVLMASQLNVLLFIACAGLASPPTGTRDPLQVLWTQRHLCGQWRVSPQQGLRVQINS